MNKWKYTLDLSVVWDNDGDGWDDSNIHMLGKIIAKRLKRLFPDYKDTEKRGFVLEEIIDEMENGICTLERAAAINKDNRTYCEEQDLYWHEVIPLDDFNNVMAELYGWADRERLWVRTN